MFLYYSKSYIISEKIPTFKKLHFHCIISFWPRNYSIIYIFVNVLKDQYNIWKLFRKTMPLFDKKTRYNWESNNVKHQWNFICRYILHQWKYAYKEVALLFNSQFLNDWSETKNSFFSLFWIQIKKKIGRMQNKEIFVSIAHFKKEWQGFLIIVITELTWITRITSFIK